MARSLGYRNAASGDRIVGTRGHAAQSRRHVRVGGLGSGDAVAVARSRSHGREAALLWTTGPVISVRLRTQGVARAPRVPRRDRQGGPRGLRSERVCARSAQYLRGNRQASAGNHPDDQGPQRRRGVAGPGQVLGPCGPGGRARRAAVQGHGQRRRRRARVADARVREGSAARRRAARGFSIGRRGFVDGSCLDAGYRVAAGQDLFNRVRRTSL